MKKVRNLFLLLLISSPLLLAAQGNPLLKKYSGAYHLLNFGEETPTASSEKITLAADGKWTSVSYPANNNGEVAKVPVKKSGTWKASEGLIQLSGSEGATEFKLDGGLFLGSSTYLQKIFVSNPAFTAKYAGSFQVLAEGEEKATEFTETVTFKPDGKCVRSTPAVDDNGAVTKTPVIAQGTWKANDGVIQMTFSEEGEDRMTEFTMKNGVFTDRGGNHLKKALPPQPPAHYLAKYAGTYHMLADGQAVTPKTDKYVFAADGKCTWTYYADGAAPVSNKGTWKAGDGWIQMSFDMGDSGDKGDGLLSEFKLQDGVFRAEGVFLKKAAAKAGPAKK